jgi:Cd2+/Zn2+-exporting ATPase
MINLLHVDDTVKALNHARLEANVRVYGVENSQKKWPSPYAVACGTLLSLSFFKYLYLPLQWLAVGAVAVGIFPIAMKGVAAIRHLRLDMNILAIIAGKLPFSTHFIGPS